MVSVYLVQPYVFLNEPKYLKNFRFEEAQALVKSLSYDLKGQQVVSLKVTSSALFFGKGKVEELRVCLQEQCVDCLIINAHITPLQQKNLEKKLQVKVLDRTSLILEIFAKRAQTREGVLQVEHARLNYQKSRLVRTWTHLERQKGGVGFLAGPGESQIEIDRRLIQQKIKKIEKELEKVKKTRELHRKARLKVPYPIVALVGYTNAGKSTLFNKLTKAGVVAEDKLFATLDPTVRLVKLPSGKKVVLADTVGFISHLPTQLIAAFKATLEEVCYADLLLNIEDGSYPEGEICHRPVVCQTLKEIDAYTPQKMLYVINKYDCMSLEVKEKNLGIAQRYSEYIVISAQDGYGLQALLQKIDSYFMQERKIHDIILTENTTCHLHWFYTYTQILERREDDTNIFLRIALDEAAENRFNKYMKPLLKKERVW